MKQCIRPARLDKCPNTFGAGAGMADALRAGKKGAAGQSCARWSSLHEGLGVRQAVDDHSRLCSVAGGDCNPNIAASGSTLAMMTAVLPLGVRSW
jgi:hypothetical protein